MLAVALATLVTLVPAPHEKPMDKLMDQAIDDFTNKGLEATKRMRKMAESTHEIGVNTLLTLNEQSERLDNVELKQEEINVDMNKADKDLTELEKGCCCTCPCFTSKSIKTTKEYRKTFGDKAEPMPRVIEDQPQRTGGAAEKGNGKRSKKEGKKYKKEERKSKKEGRAPQPMIKRITGDEREEEMDDDLQ